MQDIKHRDFQAKLIPGMSAEKMIGVRTPDLKKYAKEIFGTHEAELFMKTLPHEYFDEYQLHAFLISLIKDYDAAIKETELFLPYIDNWATCDQLLPKSFAKHNDRLIDSILEWIKSDKTYTVRFGIGMLMKFYLDDNFKPEYLKIVADIVSDKYYINMMRAWYLATALAKQYESTIKVLERNELDVWTHNKTIQKAGESYRICNEKKEYLKKLKRIK